MESVLERVLDHDELTGITTKVRTDGDTITFEDTQDIESLIEVNKALYNTFDERTPHRGDGLHRVASIPLVVLTELERQGIIDASLNVKDQRRFLRWLDDPENVFFRTRPGKLSR